MIQVFAEIPEAGNDGAGNREEGDPETGLERPL
jgi:hypothetical protein